MPNWLLTARAAAVAALLAGCASAPPGAPARPAGGAPRWEGVSGGNWVPAADAPARLRVEWPVPRLLSALPPTASTIPLRRTAWPSPVRLAHVGVMGATLLGDALPASALAGEVRCEGSRGAAEPVRLVVEVRDAGTAVAIEASFAGPELLECALSRTGRRRLERAVADTYLWVRAATRQGTLPPRDAA